MQKLPKIAKFWNKVVYGGYVPAPYTGYKNKMQPKKICIEDCNITNIKKVINS